MRLRRTTIAALVAAAVGTTALATTTFADNAAGVATPLGQQVQPQQPATGTITGPDGSQGLGTGFDEARRNYPMRPGFQGRWNQQGPGMNGPGMNGPRGMNGPGMRGMSGANALFTLACTNRGAEAIELGAVRLTYRLDLNADQKKLLDTLKTNALDAQSNYADQCKSLMPGTGDAATADPLQRLKDRLGLDQARLDAMNKLMPDIEAFYSSLTDAQKARLMPHMQTNARGPRPPMFGRMQRPVDDPTAPLPPAAPDAAGSASPSVING